MRRRHELTDAQRARIEALLPGEAGDPGRTAADNRLFVNACLFVLKAGIARADLPERFGRPNSLRKRCDRPAAAAAGVWEEVGRALGDGDLAAGEGEAQLDSSSVKARVQALPEPTRPPPPDGDFGASRNRRRRPPLPRQQPGREQAKPALRPDGQAPRRRARRAAGRLPDLVVTPGQAGGCPRAEALLAGPAAAARPGRRQVRRSLTPAYDSDALRRLVRRRRGRCCIKPDPTRKRKRRHDRQRYKHRNAIERFGAGSSGAGESRRATRRRRPTSPPSSGSPRG